jgi:hypothetical protein
MNKLFLAVAALTLAFSGGQAAFAASTGPAVSAEAPLNARSLDEVKDLSKQLLTLANKHDVPAIKQMFWNSPSALIVAKSVDPAEGNWAGFWGIEAVSKKIQDIADGGPVQLYPDYTKMKAVGLTSEVAETYIPMNIAVSYGGQDGAPHPFLMILEWVKISGDWKIASEIILPVPPAPAAKSAAAAAAHAG